MELTPRPSHHWGHGLGNGTWIDAWGQDGGR